MIYGDGTHKKPFGHGPDKCAPFDIIISYASREVDLPDGELGNNVIGGSL